MKKLTETEMYDEDGNLRNAHVNSLEELFESPGWEVLNYLFDVWTAKLNIERDGMFKTVDTLTLPTSTIHILQERCAAKIDQINYIRHFPQAARQYSKRANPQGE